MMRLKESQSSKYRWTFVSDIAIRNNKSAHRLYWMLSD